MKNFLKPLAILVGILGYLILQWLGYSTASTILIYALILLGSYELFIEIFESLRKGQFALDYIAVAAIVVSIISGQLLVGAVIALMLATGQELEKYGSEKAKESLTALVDRLPSQVVVIDKNGESKKAEISAVKIGQHILVRKGEVIPLDGVLLSEASIADESSLTGEPYFFEKFAGDIMRSGTINLGEPITIEVTKEEADSTYRKIIEMVQQAQQEKAPLIRLADKYSTFFTLITVAICILTYIFTGSLDRILAVLVVATPCPLILATPIALMGGMNACAKQRIIVKKLSSLEVLSRVNTVILDKTGTITMGRPEATQIDILDESYTREHILGIAAGIEHNSLHPLAKAIVGKANEEKVPFRHAKNVKEVIGQGIMGTLDAKEYHLVRPKEGHGMAIELLENGKKIALFHFEDQIKADTISTLKKMQDVGLETLMFTGDKKGAAERTVEKLGIRMEIRAECTPEDKKEGIEELKKAGKTTAMVGDGINDAPALALADIGMVFSNEEQTASSEAADIVFLGGDFSRVLKSVFIAQRTVRIAMQSIKWGIGLSIGCMLFAAFGFIVPVVGAIIQELIDVAVIINSLRASKIKKYMR